MTDPKRSGVTREQAALLLDPKHFRLIELLLLGEVSASEVARRLDLPIQRAYDRLRRLLAAGIAVAREEKRAGRTVTGHTVKLYASARQEWTVPFGLTSAATLTDLFAQQAEPRMRRLYEHLGSRVSGAALQGVTLRLHEGHLWAQLLPDAAHEGGLLNGQPFLTSVGGVRFTPERAGVFRDRLQALLGEFAEDDPGAPVYGLCVFFLQGDLLPRP